MDTPYFLPDPKEMTKDMFKTKLFRALFYIPGIKFDLSLSDKDFPNIPEEYIFRSSTRGDTSHIRTDDHLICFTEPSSRVRIGFVDCGMPSDGAEQVAKHLLGPSWETILDYSTYNIQKNRFIRKYHLKKLIMESIECFLIVRYVLVAKLIEIEDDTTHIGTFGY